MTKEERTEVLADELLLWIACRKYSRYIVCGWSGLWLFAGYLLSNYGAIFWLGEKLDGWLSWLLSVLQ